MIAQVGFGARCALVPAGRRRYRIVPMPDVSELLKEVRRIQIFANRQVNDILAGEYVTAFKGRGMEFDSVREYVPGDEIRNIDWNVTARSGLPHVKKFHEE